MPFYTERITGIRDGNKEQGEPEMSESVMPATAEDFYRAFCALPETERIAVMRYILKHRDETEIPNETTLSAFAEDKREMPLFGTIDELRKDLVS